MGKHRYPKPPAVVELLARLADDRLVGAACTGLAPLFDVDELPGENDEQRAERIADSAQVCGNCPVRKTCSIVADELGGMALGVWAANELGTPGRAGRPTKGTDR